MPGASQLSDAKAARTLGSEITQAGIAVYDALQHEPELQDARQRCSHSAQVLMASSACLIMKCSWLCPHTNGDVSKFERLCCLKRKHSSLYASCTSDVQGNGMT